MVNGQWDHDGVLPGPHWPLSIEVFVTAILVDIDSELGPVNDCDWDIGDMGHL